MNTILVALLALAPSTAVAAAPGPGCTCPTAQLKGGWCHDCNVGYLAAVKIKSELLFEVLDAHGHDIDPTAIGCSQCKKARESDGFCEKCRMGWVDKKAYMSRLTYHLAKGDPQDLSKIACPVCRKNARTCGWCESCKVGMLGSTAVTDRTDFAHAAKAYQRLLAAIQLLSKCETCAIAMMSDGSCLKCQVSYLSGKKILTKSP